MDGEETVLTTTLAPPPQPWKEVGILGLVYPIGFHAFQGFFLPLIIGIAVLLSLV